MRHFKYFFYQKLFVVLVIFGSSIGLIASEQQPDLLSNLAKELIINMANNIKDKTGDLKEVCKNFNTIVGPLFDTTEDVQKYAFEKRITTDEAAQQLKALQYLTIHRPLKDFFIKEQTSDYVFVSNLDRMKFNTITDFLNKFDLKSKNVDFSYTWLKNSIKIVTTSATWSFQKPIEASRASAHFNRRSLFVALCYSCLNMNDIALEDVDLFHAMQDARFDNIFILPRTNDPFDRKEDEGVAYIETIFAQLMQQKVPPFFWIIIYLSQPIAPSVRLSVIEQIIKEGNYKKWPKDTQGKLVIKYNFNLITDICCALIKNKNYTAQEYTFDPQLCKDFLNKYVSCDLFDFGLFFTFLPAIKYKDFKKYYDESVFNILSTKKDMFGRTLRDLRPVPEYKSTVIEDDQEHVD